MVIRVFRSVLTAGLLFAAPSIAFAQGAEADAVKARELERFQAMEKNDLAALDGLLAEDMIYTHSSGQADTKAQFLEALRSGKTRYVKIAPTDTNVRTFGDTAVIRGRGLFTVENQSGKNEFTLSYLDVWVKRGGKWQMVAWQSARLAAPTQ